MPVQALNSHVLQLTTVQGSWMNLLLDDDQLLATQQLSHAFMQTFKASWEPRYAQAQTDAAAATALLDPRYKQKLSIMPAADVLRGERFIEQLGAKLLGVGGDLKVKVCAVGSS
jgi:hypothetical protein